MTGAAHRPAGTHLLADFYGVDAALLVSSGAIDALLRAGAQAARATNQHTQIPGFGEGQGGTRGVLLAESHISIHTWPEFGFAAADIFMCGEAQPKLALDVIEAALGPASSIIQTIARGGAVPL